MNKKIIIVGGSGSIGSAIAKELTKEKYSIHIIGRDEKSLKEISDNINCEYSIADVLDIDKLKSTLENIEGDIHGIAYCVGSINLKPFKISKEEEYIDSFKINTLGAITSIKVVMESLIKNNGSILLFSTIAVQQGFTNHTIISSSKGAIEGLTLALAAELAPNVRVNCIAPSLTMSKMSKPLVSNEKIKKAIEMMHPIPKIGEGDDYSKIGSFLLTDKNKWMTGQILHIDGGRSSLRLKA